MWICRQLSNGLQSAEGARPKSYSWKPCLKSDLHCHVCPAKQHAVVRQWRIHRNDLLSANEDFNRDLISLAPSPSSPSVSRHTGWFSWTSSTQLGCWADTAIQSPNIDTRVFQGTALPSWASVFSSLIFTLFPGLHPSNQLPIVLDSNQSGLPLMCRDHCIILLCGSTRGTCPPFSMVPALRSLNHRSLNPLQPLPALFLLSKDSPFLAALL